ncbi:hypothetical protein [Roseomonas sp. WA12]
MTKPSATEVIKLRLATDFSFYAEHCLKIRPKDGSICPLVFNKAQRFFHEKIEQQLRETGRIRAIVLKGRQQGLSTLISGRLIYRTTMGKGLKAFQVAHKAPSTTALFDMTRRYYNSLPKLMQPSKAYSSRTELVFDKLESSYAVATAGGDGIGRAETLQLVHLSEVAFWPAGSAAQNFNGLMKAVPNKKGTEVYIESTANGVTGIFAEMWNGACAGTNGFVPIFIPWFWQDEYREPAAAGFVRTPSEEELVAKVKELFDFDLDDEQLMFRRIEIGKNGLEMFRQEYPSWAEEAFLTTGRPVFDQDQLAELLREIRPEPRRMALGLDGATFEDDKRGEMLVFAEPDIVEGYTIGADVAMGIRGRDYSVAQVLDSRKNQVAIWHGHIHPDKFGDVLYALGRWYNDAKIGCEVNNHGLVPNLKLRDRHYPNLYTTVTKDKTTDHETVKLGWDTNVKSKPMIIDELRASMRQRDITLNDRGTLTEMRSYVVTEEGKIEAEQGCHDDRVMALAIANHIHEGRWTPISNDDLYMEMI